MQPKEQKGFGIIARTNTFTTDLKILKIYLVPEAQPGSSFLKPLTR